MVSKACGVCVGLGLATVVLSSSAQAQEQGPAQVQEQPQPNRAHRSRHEAVVLSLNGSLVNYEKQTVQPEKLEGSSVELPEVSTSQTTYGPLGAGLGLGIGYAWDQVVLGVRAQLTKVDLSPPSGNDASATEVSLLPRLEYMFTRDTARPFIAGILGIQYSGSDQTTSSVSSSGNSSSFKIEDSSTSLAVGGAFGVHGFLRRSVSIDPELTVLYSSGSGTTKAESPSGPSVNGSNSSNTSSQDYSTSSVRVLFSIGLSGWLDTGGPLPPPPPRAEVTQPPSTYPAPPISEEPESKPISADVRLPQHRRIYLQVPKDPARPSVLVRLTARRSDKAISNCDDVTLALGSAPLRLPVRSRGENYLTTRLPIVGLEALANNPDLVISVCGDEWPITPEAREAIQDLLKARRELLEQLGEVDDASPAPAPAPDAASAAPTSSAGAPAPAPVSAPGSVPAPAPTHGPAPAPAPAPSGAFPPAPTTPPATDKAGTVPPKAPKAKP